MPEDLVCDPENLELCVSEIAEAIAQWENLKQGSGPASVDTEDARLQKEKKEAEIASMVQEVYRQIGRNDDIWAKFGALWTEKCHVFLNSPVLRAEARADFRKNQMIRLECTLYMLLAKKGDFANWYVETEEVLGSD